MIYKVVIMVKTLDSTAIINYKILKCIPKAKRILDVKTLQIMILLDKIAIQF